MLEAPSTAGLAGASEPPAASLAAWDAASVGRAAGRYLRTTFVMDGFASGTKMASVSYITVRVRRKRTYPRCTIPSTHPAPILLLVASTDRGSEVHRRTFSRALDLSRDS